MAGKTFRMPPPPPKPVIKPPTVDFVSTGSGGEVMRCVGAKSLVDNLLALGQPVMEAAVREMVVIADEVIERAKDEFVPIDKGDLKDSGDHDDYIPGAKQTIEQIAMWFGGEPTVEQSAHGMKDVRLYALEQHENMELHHPPLKDRMRGINPGNYFRPGGPKYLERPFLEMVPKIKERIIAAVSATLSSSQQSVRIIPIVTATTSDQVTAVDPNTIANKSRL